MSSLGQQSVREAYLAGSWYPDDPAACRDVIATMTDGFVPPEGEWNAVVVPHAGWVYSGAAAARGMAVLAAAEAASDADLVVIFGSHLGPSDPCRVFTGAAWMTPFGPLETDGEVAAAVLNTLKGMPQLTVGVTTEPLAPMRPDNAVEVNLPLIKHFFPAARLLMVAVPPNAQAVEVGASVGRLCREMGRKPVFMGSTDLTHYGPNYAFEPHGRGDQAVEWVRETNDRRFIAHVLGYDPAAAVEDATAHQSACCAGAVAAMMGASSRDPDASPDVHLIEHYLSYDVRRDASFVGYASIVM